MGLYVLPESPTFIRVSNWRRIGEGLFGLDRNQWELGCPDCGERFTVADCVDAFGKINHVDVGTKCPKCHAVAHPPATPGPETCFRVLYLPEDAPPNQTVADCGEFLFVLPFWVPDGVTGPDPLYGGEARGKTPTEWIPPDNRTEVPVPVPSPPPAPKPAPKKGAPSGYGFQL